MVYNIKGRGINFPALFMCSTHGIFAFSTSNEKIHLIDKEEKNLREGFVPAAEAYRRLKFAEEGNSCVYIYGATGYGKTTLIKEFLCDRECINLSPSDIEWDLTSLENNENRTEPFCIVVDDLQFLKYEQHKQILKNLAKRDDVWLILSGRMSTPIWLMPLVAEGNMVVIKEENLRLSALEVKRIAANNGVKIGEENAVSIAKDGQGNAYIIATIINMMKSGEVFDENLQNKIRSIFIKHLETNIISQWSTEVQEFLMKLSVVDEFTLPLAVTITGENRATMLLEQAAECGNFFAQKEDTYIIRPLLIEALRRSALNTFGLNKYNQYINNAGLYYEMQDDYETAIRMYESSGNKEAIRNILIRSARRHPGAVNMYELRHYYLSLEESDIVSSPVLMSVMSMIQSIMMNPEKSEYWYDKLKQFSESKKGAEKREANEQLLYLDIGLPHRGSVDLSDVFLRTPGIIKNGGMKLPEFSVTNNQPSVMNGGKDFCSWSKRDELMADTIGRLVEKMLGDMGKGLIHAALCESFYEKGGRDEEVLHHAIMHQMEVESGGKVEMLFVSVAVQIRLYLLLGNTFSALQLLNSFEERVKKEKKDNLIPCLNAFKCRVALLMRNEEAIEEWMENAPNEQIEFWVLYRYQYLTKVRCYIASGENTEALNLIEKLLYYADISKRTYIRMECKLLKSIALRQEKREWKNTFLEALSEIKEYSFVRIISEKGAGILPLLKDIKNEYLESENADKAWYNRVLKETKTMADFYPHYLVCDSVQPKDFTDIAIQILKMQSEGASIKEIAAKLNMSERTAKYHASENYHKLNAKGKTDAVQIAKSLNLI